MIDMTNSADVDVRLLTFELTSGGSDCERSPAILRISGDWKRFNGIKESGGGAGE